MGGWVSERVEVGWKLWVNRWIDGWWISRVYGGLKGWLEWVGVWMGSKYKLE